MNDGEEKRGRPSAFRPEFCAQADELCKLGAIDKDLAEFFEVDERTINRWKEAHPEFRQSIRAGKIIADMAVAGRLHQRALGFEYEENHPIKLKKITYADNGKKLLEEEYVQIVPVKRVVPPDTVAVKFWLTNRSDKWRDKVDVNAQHSGEIEVTITDSEAARRVAYMLGRAVGRQEAKAAEAVPAPADEAPAE